MCMYFFQVPKRPSFSSQTWAGGGLELRGFFEGPLVRRTQAFG